MVRVPALCNRVQNRNWPINLASLVGPRDAALT
jgi:hypothetical protein